MVVESCQKHVELKVAIDSGRSLYGSTDIWRRYSRRKRTKQMPHAKLDSVACVGCTIAHPERRDEGTAQSHSNLENLSRLRRLIEDLTDV